MKWKDRINEDTSFSLIKTKLTLKNMEEHYNPIIQCPDVLVKLDVNFNKADSKLHCQPCASASNMNSNTTFCKVFLDGSCVKLIVYVDDNLFFGNNEATLQEFKDKLRYLMWNSSDKPIGIYQPGLIRILTSMSPWTRLGIAKPL